MFALKTSLYMLIYTVQAISLLDGVKFKIFYNVVTLNDVNFKFGEML